MNFYDYENSSELALEKFDCQKSSASISIMTSKFLHQMHD